MRLEETRRTSSNDQKLIACSSWRGNGSASGYLTTFLLWVSCFHLNSKFLTRSFWIQHADNMQQAFSSDQGTTLHLALPTLEALHKAWTKRAARSKYRDFIPALEAGLAKIEEYYDHTADSDTYTFAICEITFLSCFVRVWPSFQVLDPSNKTEHIRKFWGDEKLKSILKNAEAMVSIDRKSVV